MNPVVVEYARHYTRYTEEFDTIEEAARWIEDSEDHGDIFAVSVSQDGRVLFEYVPQPGVSRWDKTTPDGPDWPGKYP